MPVHHVYTSPSFDLVVKLSNSELGEVIHFEIKPGEVLQFHSHLAFDDDLTVAETDYIEILAQDDPSAADIFIGLKELS